MTQILLVGRTIDKATRQITRQIGFKHPEINAHSRVRWIGRRPMGRAATVRAMPCVERTITMLVGNALSLDRDQVRRAIVPQSSGASTNRAIAFTDFGWLVAQGHANPPAMAAAVVLDHRRFLLIQVVFGVCF
jgi:hypothetical protein